MIEKDINVISGKKLTTEVSMPYTLYKSLKGEYFVGQTNFLVVGKGSYAWGGLINPIDSGVNLFVNVITISNYSGSIFTAGIWFNSVSPETGTISKNVSPADTAIESAPKPKVELQFVQSLNQELTGGINVFNRIVPPNGTLVEEEDGKFVFSPGGSCIIFLKSENEILSKEKIAFGWWEEKIKI